MAFRNSYCPNCGTQILSKQVAVCPDCGHRLQGRAGNGRSFQTSLSQQSPITVPQDQYSGLCIAGLALSVVPVLGLVLSISGVISANRSGKKGAGAGIAGIMFGVIFTLAILLPWLMTLAK